MMSTDDTKNSQIDVSVIRTWIKKVDLDQSRTSQSSSTDRVIQTKTSR
jgi:hypothetical protein